MAIRHQVGLKIRDLRRANGLTQDQLAARIDKSTQTVSQIERGAFAPSLDTIEAIAKALKAPPALMFPATISAKGPSAKDKVVSAIMANAIRLTKEDAETVLALATHLNKRSR